MRRHYVVFAVLATALAPACTGETDIVANCGHQGVSVTYRHEADLATACDALDDTLGYFRRIGFELEPRFSLNFAEPGKQRSIEGVVSYGYVDLRSSTIVVYSSSYRQPWGLPWSREMIGSFLRHELAHIAVWQMLGRKAERLRHEWHEFIAYAIQLDLLNPELRKEALANFSDVRPFSDLLEVNEFTYGMNPDVFAVAAYLAYRERGAERFVRALLRGEITPPPFVYPFPVLPDQSPR